MSIESEADLVGLRRAGEVVAKTLAEMQRRLRVGMTTAELDDVGARVMEAHGARSAPQMFYRFPGVNLISVNDEVVHGIPGDRVIRPGDLVSLDVTAELDGYIADAAVSVPVAPVSSLARALCRCAKAAFEEALQVARVGHRVRAIGRAVEGAVKREGFTVVRSLSGHGLGRVIHEAPTVPNYDDPWAVEPLTEGLVITIEPVIASGGGRVVESDDGWTVRTVDGSLAAHYEHTLVITRGRPLLLTAA